MNTGRNVIGKTLSIRGLTVRTYEISLPLFERKNID